MLGSVKGVKSENPKGKGEIRKWKGGVNQIGGLGRTIEIES